MPADDVDGGDPVDLLAEELDADGALLVARREDLHDVAAHTERAALKLDVAAVVLNLDEAAHQLVALHRHARAQGDHHALVFAWVAHRVDAGDGGDDDHVPALAQRGCRAVAQALDLLVDGGVLLDVGIGRGDVGLRLIVVIIGDEILDGAVREELAELRAQLRRQGLVVRDDERRALEALDDRGHRIGLAGTCDAQEHLAGHARLRARDERLNGLRLIALGLERGLENKAAVLHERPPSAGKTRMVCPL